MKAAIIPDEALKEFDFLFGVPVGIVIDVGFDPRYDIELLRYTDAWEKLELSYVWEGEGNRWVWTGMWQSLRDFRIMR